MTTFLLIASKNPGKIKEIKEILNRIPFEIKSLVDINYEGEIEETGKSFEENAILKAKSIGRKTGLLTLADDSGLEVDVLGGRPGVYSSRYTSGTDLDRINMLLRELKDIPEEKRTAKFRSVVAVYIPSTISSQFSLSSSPRRRGSSWIPDQVGNDNSFRIVTFEGECRGRIIDKPKGNNGFGYDPVFFSFDIGKTFGEASDEEKNKISHRARALQKTQEFLINTY